MAPYVADVCVRDDGAGNWRVVLEEVNPWHDDATDIRSVGCAVVCAVV